MRILLFLTLITVSFTQIPNVKSEQVLNNQTFLRPQVIVKPLVVKIDRPLNIRKQNIKYIRWPEQQIPEVPITAQPQFKIPTYPQGTDLINTINVRQYQLSPVKKDLQITKAQPQFCNFKRSIKRPPSYDPTQRQRLVVTNYGFNMYVDSHDSAVSNIISITGTWEPENINLIGHIVKKGHNILNLGAQSGLQALIMGKIIGPSGKLFVFQPYTVSYNILKKNIQLNNLTSITTLYKKGASDEKGKAQIRIDYSNTGGSQIGPKIPSQRQNQIDTTKGPQVLQLKNGQIQYIQLDLVDNLLPADAKIDFTLIDVQKMQVQALRGMKNIIERSPNLVMMVQWQYNLNARKDKQKTKQLLQWLQNRGYKIYFYNRGGSYSCKVGNFYQIPKQKLLRYTVLTDIFLFPSTVPLPQ